MQKDKRMTWGLRITTLAIGVLLVIQGELLIATLMFLVAGGLEWSRSEENDEENKG